MVDETIINHSKIPLNLNKSNENDINNEPLRNHEDSQRIISNIKEVNNREDGSYFIDNGFTRILASAWKRLHPSTGNNVYDGDNDKIEKIYLTDVYSKGDEICLLSKSFQTSRDKKKFIPEFRGGFFKRCLVGAGILTGSGILGSAGYQYYERRNRGDEPSKSFNSTGLEKSPFNLITPYNSHIQDLDNSFGNHSLHHDINIKRIRHNRRNTKQVKIIRSEKYDDVLGINARSSLVRFFTQKANEGIIMEFQKKRLLGSGFVSKEELLSATFQYLFIEGEQVSLRVKEAEILAKEILYSYGVYGGENNEVISSELAEYVVRNWVISNVLHIPLEEYIANEVKEKNIKGNYDINMLITELSMDTLIKKGNIDFKKIESQKDEFKKMWNYFIMKGFPFIRFNDTSVRSMLLKSHEFANLYSGTLFLERILITDYTPEEAMEVGKKIWGLAMSEGATEDKLSYLKFPALFFIASNPYKDDVEFNRFSIVDKYLQYRNYINNLNLDIEEKYKTYLSSTKSWLTKGKLADRIISDCPVIHGGLPDIADAIRTKEERRIKGEAFAKQTYLNNMGKPCKTAPDHLDDEYRKLTSSVADSFYYLDKYLILSAIEGLSDDDHDFISSPHAIFYSANAFIQMGQRGSFFISKKHFIDGTDLITVKIKGQERIYAIKGIKKSETGYVVIRVDRDIKKYITSGILGERFDDYKPTWDNIEDSDDIVNFNVYNEEAITKKSTSNINEIAESIAEKHRNKLYDNLYNIGNDKSDIQKIWGVIKHIIPFYDCIESSINNDVETAIPACLIDAVSFVPVFGQVVSLSNRFGIGVARGLKVAMLEVGNIGIKSSGKLLLRETTLPTIAELSILGKTTLRAIDPGLELLKSTSMVFNKKITDLLLNNKKTVGLVKRIISNNALKNSQNIVSDNIITALLPGSKIRVPVKYAGKKNTLDVYVRYNPETGEPFGRFYYLEKEHLIPVYYTIAKKDSQMSTIEKNVVFFPPKRLNGRMGYLLSPIKPPKFAEEQKIIEVKKDEQQVIEKLPESLQPGSSGLQQSSFISEETLSYFDQLPVEIKEKILIYVKKDEKINIRWRELNYQLKSIIDKYHLSKFDRFIIDHMESLEKAGFKSEDARKLSKKSIYHKKFVLDNMFSLQKYMFSPVQMMELATYNKNLKNYIFKNMDNLNKLGFSSNDIIQALTFNGLKHSDFIVKNAEVLTRAGFSPKEILEFYRLESDKLNYIINNSDVFSRISQGDTFSPPNIMQETWLNFFIENYDILSRAGFRKIDIIRLSDDLDTKESLDFILDHSSKLFRLGFDCEEIISISSYREDVRNFFLSHAEVLNNLGFSKENVKYLYLLRNFDGFSMENITTLRGLNLSPDQVQDIIASVEGNLTSTVTDCKLFYHAGFTGNEISLLYKRSLGFMRNLIYPHLQALEKIWNKSNYEIGHIAQEEWINFIINESDNLFKLGFNRIEIIRLSQMAELNRNFILNNMETLQKADFLFEDIFSLSLKAKHIQDFVVKNAIDFHELDFSPRIIAFLGELPREEQNFVIRNANAFRELDFSELDIISVRRLPKEMRDFVVGNAKFLCELDFTPEDIIVLAKLSQGEQYFVLNNAKTLREQKVTVDQIIERAKSAAT